MVFGIEKQNNQTQLVWYYQYTLVEQDNSKMLSSVSQSRRSENSTGKVSKLKNVETKLLLRKHKIDENGQQRNGKVHWTLSLTNSQGIIVAGKIPKNN